MFHKTIEVTGDFTGCTSSYDCLWDGEVVLPSLDPEQLWVPRYGWHQGLFYDGPILWRGNALLDRGGPGHLTVAGLYLDGPAKLYDDSFSYELAIESLKWAARESFRALPCGLATILEVRFADFNLETALQLVLLRRAFLSSEFCFFGEPPNPAWRRFFQNINLRFQKSLTSFHPEQSVDLSLIFPEIKPSMLGGLLAQVNRRSQVVPYQCSKNAL